MKVGIFGGGAIAGYLKNFIESKNNYSVISYSKNQLDIRDQWALDDVISREQFNYLFNLAAYSDINKSFDNPLDYYNVNCFSVLGILDSIRNFSPETKFINAGSIKELDNASPYSGSKLCSGKIIDNYRKSYKIWAAQPLLSNILVPRDNDKFVVAKIVNYFKKGQFSKPLELGDVDSSKKWLSVEDVVAGLFDIALNNIPYDFILSGEKEVSVREIVRIAAETIGIYGIWDNLNGDLVFMDKVKVYVRNNSSISRKNECNVQYDIEETKNILGWRPKISVEESIRKMINE